MFIEEIFMKIEKINKDNIKEYIRDMGIDITYVDEKQLINNTFGVKKDNKFLSTKYEMSDIAFAKWNRSIYQYDKNSSNLVLKRGINVTKDVPRVVRNVVKASSIKSSNVYAR